MFPFISIIKSIKDLLDICLLEVGKYISPVPIKDLQLQTLVI